MLIVAGHVVVNPTDRDAYVAECVVVVEAAREAPGCHDFSITADSLDPSRIRISERWENEQRTLEFRGSRPADSHRRSSSKLTSSATGSRR
jgi:quinol monooxygenase YgiN